MENTSKALIIAGTILIVMVVIGAGMFLYNRAGGLSGAVQSNWSQDEILAFNRQFTKYEGEQKGSTVKALIEAVNKSNERSDVEVSFSNYVYVNESNGTWYANSKLINTKTYNISFGYEDSVITSITIE